MIRDGKVFWTIADISLAAKGLSRHKVRYILKSAGVDFVRFGRTLYITDEEFQLKLPDLWELINRPAPKKIRSKATRITIR